MSTSGRPLRHPNNEDATTYARALLDASGRVPYERVDWDVFHTRLAARAELSLARLRHPRLAPLAPGRSVVTLVNNVDVSLAWCEYAARWSRFVVSASVAAGVVLVMVVRRSPKDVVDTMVASTSAAPYPIDGTRAVFESAALGRGSTWTIDSALQPSAAELLIPLGRTGASQ